MEISDNLLCLFSGQVEERHGSHVIEIPSQELTHGDIQSGSVYRVAIFSTQTAATAEASSTQTEPTGEDDTEANREREMPGPPVQTGEVRDVEIEDIGDQGDGIARVERGYVIIVPETEQGDQVRIEITTVRENVAFGEVVEREEHFQ